MKNWSKEGVSALRVKELSEKYGIDPISASILIRRGFDNEESLRYFIVHDEIVLHSPFLFKDMQVFTDRVKKAIDNKEKIFLFGDRDTDGITSLALMHNWLNKVGVENVLRLPTGDDNYGLSLESVEEAIKEGCTLVITVDCGITATESVKALNEKNIDVLIVDHHLPPEDEDKIPNALVIIDPKYGKCGYPFQGLSAAGVVYKCIQALEFAKTQHYNTASYLFSAEFGKTGKTVILSMLKTRNLIEEKRIKEEWALDSTNYIKDSEILQEIISTEDKVFVFKSDEIRQILDKVFDLSDVSLPLIELQPRIVKYFPRYKRSSLLDISRIIPYYKIVPSSSQLLDTFYYLFYSCIVKSSEGLSRIQEENLDLVAISTVADLMPIVNENHLLVRLGLDIINKNPRHSIRPFLAQKALVMRPITAIDISFYISPVINSAGRMGNSELALNLLLSEDNTTTEVLSRELFALNVERKNTGDESWKIIKNIAEDSFKKNKEKFVFVASSDIPRGFTGLSSARALKAFNVPSVIIAVHDNQGSGSIRTPECVNALEFIQNFKDILNDFGAHQCAGGFSIDGDKVEELERRMCELAENEFIGPYLEENIIVDAELPAHLASSDLLKINEFIGPFGAGNPPLVFFIKDFIVDRADCFDIRNETGLRLTLIGGGIRFSAIGWTHGKLLNTAFKVGDKVNILTHVEKNYFRGNCNLQFNIIDIEKA